MVGGANGSASVQRDIILGVGVHQQANGSFWRGVNKEVDVDVGSVQISRRTVLFPFSSFHIVRNILPLDELLARNGIGIGCIIDEYGILLGCGIAIDNHLIVASLDGDVARGIDRAVEIRIAKVGKVVSQQVFCLNAHIERHASKVFVMNAS